MIAGAAGNPQVSDRKREEGCVVEAAERAGERARGVQGGFDEVLWMGLGVGAYVERQTLAMMLAGGSDAPAPSLGALALCRLRNLVRRHDREQGQKPVEAAGPPLPGADLKPIRPPAVCQARASWPFPSGAAPASPECVPASARGERVGAAQGPGRYS